MTASRLIQAITGKNVVFITVKNRKYIRVSQIERLLQAHAANFSVYASEKGNPLTRAMDLKRRIPGIDFADADVVIVGFLPQLVWKDVMKAVRKAGRAPIDKSGGATSKDSRPKLLADFFVSMYDTVALDRQLVSDGSFVARKLRGLDRKVLKEADLIISDTNVDAKFFAEEYKIDPVKFETLYLEADKKIYSEEEFAHIPKDEGWKKRRDAEVRDGVNVLYFGTGLPLQGTDIILRAFALIAARDKNISCTFIGSLKGIPKPVVDVARLYSDIEIIDWLSQEDLADRIRLADICLAGHFNAEIDKANRTIPGKAFIYEAMNKPMILGDTTANHELFSQDDRHFFVPRGDAIALAECIADRIKTSSNG